MIKLTTEWRGKFRHTFVHDNDFDLEKVNKRYDLLRVGPGPYHQNRLILAFHNGIISPYYDGSYTDFLKTKEWKEARDEVMECYGPECFICQKRKAEHVHHETYQFGWLPFIHDMNVPKGTMTPTLIPVCNLCHVFEHVLDGKIK